MMRRFTFTCLILGGLGAAALSADVRLPALLSDHMVLQESVPVRIWGWADPGEDVTVEFEGQTVSSKTGEAGKWAVYLNPLKAGGPDEMTVTGRNKLVIHDVLVGEVWVGSGQSNMQWPLDRTDNAEQEIARANFPSIRLFEVKRVVADSPADDVTGAWHVCTPESVRQTSAVGYFFSWYLHQRLRIPVGLIHSSWGGTPAQSWTSHPALESEPALRFILDDWEKTLANYPAAQERYEKKLAEWQKQADEAKAQGTEPPRRPYPPVGPGHPNTPAGLYNSMIAPLTPFAIRGVIWYQGESNAFKKQAYEYRRLFPLMIEDWWRAWGEGRFPFLFVQLASFESNGYWPVLRESQLETLKLRNTGMAVTVDIGEQHNIHPKNKREVGRRLSLIARALVYGDKVEYSGPMFRQFTTEGNRIRLWFDDVGGGLQARGGGSLTGFTIAGPDKKFVPAEANIDGDNVIVSSPEVQAPVAVRYAWEDYPTANLTDKEGLPASPFRTDRWEYEPPTRH